MLVPERGSAACLCGWCHWVVRALLTLGCGLSAGRARTRQPRGPYPSQRCGTDLFLKANQQFDVVKQHVTVVTEFGYFPKLSKKKYI